MNNEEFIENEKLLKLSLNILQELQRNAKTAEDRRFASGFADWAYELNKKVKEFERGNKLIRQGLNKFYITKKEPKV